LRSRAIGDENAACDEIQDESKVAIGSVKDDIEHTVQANDYVPIAGRSESGDTAASRVPDPGH